ncbi:MAG: DUF4838 domain-containing protein [Planctomycetota bacterium]
MHAITRRQFLQTAATAVCAQLPATQLGFARSPPGNGAPQLCTRGVVLVPDDLTLTDWSRRAAAAGLTTIALHASAAPRKVVVPFVRSAAGQQFLATCAGLGLQVEYELHALRELLPRERFAQEPALFRMNEQHVRTADANLCVHSARALEIVAENAVQLARDLPPTTGRYFYWTDDAEPGCRCPDCSALSDSDQALIVENHIIAALRKVDARARLAHLAYQRTMPAPTQIKPVPGVFLEFAPIERRYDIALGADDPAQRRVLDLLDANLRVFGAEHAQALEYWLDCSRFSHYQKPAVKVPFDQVAFAADVATYAARGIRHLTSFAVFIDRDYVGRHGEPPLDLYGKVLNSWREAR